MSEANDPIENNNNPDYQRLYEKLLKENKALKKNQHIVDKQMTKSRKRTIDLFGKMIDVKKAQRIISWQNEELEEKNKEINNKNKAIEHTYQKFRERTIELFGKMIDLKKANKTIQAQRDEIEKQRKLLDEINTSKDKFFSILAHDLKNPIGGFLGLTELMVTKKSQLDEGVQETFIENLYENSKQLYSLLENLLEWARSQTGSLTINKQTLELNKVLESAISHVSTNAQLKNINLKSITNMAVKIFADNDTLTTVLRNLLSNAIKFSEPGSDINIAVSEIDSMVKLSIIDNGIGIKPKQLNKLFKIENSETSVGTANEKGTGLGLILCKEFMEVNGGSIAVESDVNKGSTFTISIPTNKHTV